MRPPGRRPLSDAHEGHGQPVVHRCADGRSERRWKEARPRPGRNCSRMSDPFDQTAVDQAKALKLSQRDALIKAALPHVPFDGWTIKTLQAAAESAGLGK